MDGILKELQEQKEAILSGTWVSHAPMSAMQACLAERRGPQAKPRYLGFWARRYALRAIPLVDERFEEDVHTARVRRKGSNRWFSMMDWNDGYAKGPNDVIAVLDEAMRMRKEDMRDE